MRLELVFSVVKGISWIVLAFTMVTCCALAVPPYHICKQRNFCKVCCNCKNYSQSSDWVFKSYREIMGQFFFKDSHMCWVWEIYQVYNNVRKWKNWLCLISHVTLNLNQGPLSIYCLYQYNLLLASSNKWHFSDFSPMIWQPSGFLILSKTPLMSALTQVFLTLVYPWCKLLGGDGRKRNPQEIGLFGRLLRGYQYIMGH